MHRADAMTFRTFTSPGPSESVFVLVHGIGMSHRYLKRLHRTLRAHGTVVSVDLPGFGGLPKPTHDADVTRVADGLGTVIDELGIGPAVLVGHSMGTQWVVELAVRRPDLARAVVTIGPVTDDRARTVRQQAGALMLDTLGEPPGANALVFGDYVRCGPVWYLRQLRHMLAYPIEDRAGLLGVPLLIVRGARDPIARRAWCRRLRAAAREAALVEIPGRVHNAQHTAPRAVAAAILHNLASITQPGSLPSAPARRNGP
jgi:pimeloyl-ACP methyl ester carboxylesterase